MRKLIFLILCFSTTQLLFAQTEEKSTLTQCEFDQIVRKKLDQLLFLSNTLDPQRDALFLDEKVGYLVCVRMWKRESNYVKSTTTSMYLPFARIESGYWPGAGYVVYNGVIPEVFKGKKWIDFIKSYKKSSTFFLTTESKDHAITARNILEELQTMLKERQELQKAN